jgi:hypothetical protein
MHDNIPPPPYDERESLLRTDGTPNVPPPSAPPATDISVEASFASTATGNSIQCRVCRSMVNYNPGKSVAICQECKEGTQVGPPPNGINNL